MERQMFAEGGYARYPKGSPPPFSDDLTDPSGLHKTPMGLRRWAEEYLLRTTNSVPTAERVEQVVRYIQKNNPNLQAGIGNMGTPSPEQEVGAGNALLEGGIGIPGVMLPPPPQPRYVEENIPPNTTDAEAYPLLGGGAGMVPRDENIQRSVEAMRNRPVTPPTEVIPENITSETEPGIVPDVSGGGGPGEPGPGAYPDSVGAIDAAKNKSDEMVEKDEMVAGEEGGFSGPSRRELLAMGASLMGSTNKYGTVSGTMQNIGDALGAGNKAGLAEDVIAGRKDVAEIGYAARVKAAGLKGIGKRASNTEQARLAVSIKMQMDKGDNTRAHLLPAWAQGLPLWELVQIRDDPSFRDKILDPGYSKRAAATRAKNIAGHAVTKIPEKVGKIPGRVEIVPDKIVWGPPDPNTGIKPRYKLDKNGTPIPFPAKIDGG